MAGLAAASDTQYSLRQLPNVFVGSDGHCCEGSHKNAQLTAIISDTSYHASECKVYHSSLSTNGSLGLTVSLLDTLVTGDRRVLNLIEMLRGEPCFCRGDDNGHFTLPTPCFSKSKIGRDIARCFRTPYW